MKHEIEIEFADNGIILTETESEWCEVVEFENGETYLSTSKKAHQAIGKSIAENLEEDILQRHKLGTATPIGYRLQINAVPFFKVTKK